jgi:Domain of unknown function (DUF305)
MFVAPHILMFVSMVAIHLLIMPLLMLDSLWDWRISRFQIMIAAFMGFAMVLVESVMHPLPSIVVWMIFAVMVLLLVAARRQWWIRDTDYLDDMIPHHAMAVLTSRGALRRTTNSNMRAFADRILQTQTREIAEMKKWREMM